MCCTLYSVRENSNNNNNKKKPAGEEDEEDRHFYFTNGADGNQIRCTHLIENLLPSFVHQ